MKSDHRNADHVRVINEEEFGERVRELSSFSTSEETEQVQK